MRKKVVSALLTVAMVASSVSQAKVRPVTSCLVVLFTTLTAKGVEVEVPGTMESVSGIMVIV